MRSITRNGLITAICTTAIICCLVSCKDHNMVEAGPYNVTVSQGRYVDSCTYQYDIGFSDKLALGIWEYYWVGLLQEYPSAAGLGLPFSIVCCSEMCLRLEEVFTETLTVTLTSSATIREDSPIYAFAFKTEYESSCCNKDQFLTYAYSSDAVGLPSFPDSCPGSGSDPNDPPLPSDLNLRLLCGSEVILQDNPVYVTPTPVPSMPLLVAKIASDVPEGMASWGLTITYNRSGRSDTMTWEWCQEAEYIWNIWELWGDSIMGGQALLVCTTLIDGRVGYLPFCIRAKNPPEDTVVDFIENLPNNMWYTKYVAKHESAPPQNGRYYLQFNEVGHMYCLPTDTQYTPNASGDGGFGLFQLTNFVGEYGGTMRKPNTRELWSWRQNAISGGFYLDTVLADSWRYMITQRLNANLVPVQDHYVAPVLFSDDSDTTIEHAVTMKRYNGLGILKEEYCRFDTMTYNWVLSDSSIRVCDTAICVNYYVRDVCSKVDPWRVINSKENADALR